MSSNRVYSQVLIIGAGLAGAAAAERLAARGWQVELMNAGETELGGYREIVFSIEGEKVFSRLKFESGIHRTFRSGKL